MYQSLVVLVVLATPLFVDAEAPRMAKDSSTEAKVPTYCFSTEAKEAYFLRGTETPYTVPKDPPQVAPSSSEHGICEPVMVWTMARTGLSWPTIDMVDGLNGLSNIKNKILSGLNKFCLQDQGLLQTLKQPTYSASNKGLHPIGKRGFEALGQRIKSYFPKLFTEEPFTDQNYIVQFGNKEWLYPHEGAMEFVKGFTSSSEISLIEYGKLEDHVWELDNCKDKERSSSVEKPLKDSIQEVKTRIGAKFFYKKDYTLMMSACSMESSFDGDNPTLLSPWCVPFSPKDMEAFEYQEDLDNFAKTTSQNDFEKKAVCPLIKDLFSRFKLYVDNPTSHHPKGIFYFAFPRHLNLVVSALGLMDDSSPLDMKTIKKDRKYRTSHFLGYQGNLMAVLYECSKTPSTKTYRVKFFINERDDLGDMDLHELLKKFDTYINSGYCNYKSCDHDSAEEPTEHSKNNPLPLGVTIHLGNVVDKEKTLESLDPEPFVIMSTGAGKEEPPRAGKEGAPRSDDDMDVTSLISVDDEEILKDTGFDLLPPPSTDSRVDTPGNGESDSTTNTVATSQSFTPSTKGQYTPISTSSHNTDPPKQHSWYWWIFGFPFVAVSAALKFSFTPFRSSPSSKSPV